MKIFSAFGVLLVRMGSSVKNKEYFVLKSISAGAVPHSASGAVRPALTLAGS